MDLCCCRLAVVASLTAAANILLTGLQTLTAARAGPVAERVRQPRQHLVLAGRHKHCQPAMASAAASLKHERDFSLAFLPGPAIASILHHLDIYSSYQLALTCQACAREAAHHRTHYKDEYCAQILPKVQSIAGDYGFPYGSLSCAWTGTSSDALPYIHTMSIQPDFLASMWKAAWSTVPHSFFTDLNSMLGDAMSGKVKIMNHCSPLTIHLFIRSTTPLHVPLAWLQAFCETAKATIIEKFLDAVSGYVDDAMDIACWVYRPQGQLHEDEFAAELDEHESPLGGPWKYVCQNPPPSMSSLTSQYTPVASNPEHSIAVTGSWCEFEGLP